MSYYPYTIHVPGWCFRLEEVPLDSHYNRLFSGPLVADSELATDLEIALATRIKDLEIALRAVIDRAAGFTASPRLMYQLLTDDSVEDIRCMAVAALETPC